VSETIKTMAIKSASETLVCDLNASIILVNHPRLVIVSNEHRSRKENN